MPTHRHAVRAQLVVLVPIAFDFDFRAALDADLFGALRTDIDQDFPGGGLNDEAGTENVGDGAGNLCGLGKR